MINTQKRIISELMIAAMILIVTWRIRKIAKNLRSKCLPLDPSGLFNIIDHFVYDLSEINIILAFENFPSCVQLLVNLAVKSL
jgi:hypothetical protein